MKRTIDRLKRFFLGTRPFGQSKIYYVIKRLFWFGSFVAAIQNWFLFFYGIFTEPGIHSIGVIFPAVIATGFCVFLDS